MGNRKFDYKKIGKIIQIHLLNPSLSHEEIAMRCGVSKHTVCYAIINHKQSIKALYEITKHIPDDIEPETNRKAA